MGRTDDIEALKRLKMQIDTAQQEADRYNVAKAARDEAQNRLNNAVYQFDEQHKEAYITGIIGEKPEKQSGLWAFFENYNERLAEYLEKYRTQESEYYMRYAREREAIQREAQKKYDSCIGELTDRQRIYDEARLALINNGIIPGKLKTPDTVQQLIDFLEDGRCTTIRQSVNMLYEEQYKQRMEKKANEILERLSFLESRLNSVSDDADEAKRVSHEVLNEIRRMKNG